MKLPFKTLWAEFKAFAFKGNMIELAVAVVIGAAFGKVIDSMVHDIVMPTIFLATSTVKDAKDAAVKGVEKAADKAKDVAGIATSQPASQPATQPADVAAAPPPVAAAPAAPAPTPAAGAPAPPKKDETKVVDLSWKIQGIDLGHFIGELLNFVIVAFAVFIMIVKLLGSVMKRAGGTPKASEPTTRECPECLSIIPIKAKRCAHCTAVVAPLPATTTT
jgi:large conductance mechanosensitive channel